MATPIEQAPQWVRDLLPSPDELAAGHAEAQAALEAVRRGDRSQVMTAEQLDAWLSSLEDTDAQAS